MLVTRRKTGLTLVDQNEHGRLAGEFTHRWGNKSFEPPTRTDQVAVATSMHDNGWIESDNLPLYNSDEKRPLHFLEMSLEEHLPLYQRGVERVYDEDKYAGLLAGMHWTGLYRNRWGMRDDGTAGITAKTTPLNVLEREYLLPEEVRWNETKRELVDGLRSEFEQRLWYHYDLLQVWDMLSLFVAVADMEFTGGPELSLTSTLASIDQEPGARLIKYVPQSIGGPRATIRIEVAEPGVAKVDPWPFHSSDFDVTLPAKIIPDVPYQSREAVAEAFAQGQPTRLECRFRKA